MYIKKVALRITVLGVAAVAVMATDQTIDWETTCVKSAIVLYWKPIGIQLRKAILTSGDTFDSKYYALSRVIGINYMLPNVPNLEIFQKVVDIVGADFMQLALSTILNGYLIQHSCFSTDPTLSALMSSDYSLSTDTYSTESSDTSTSDSDSTSSFDLSSSDTYSTESSDSSSSDIHPTIISDSSSSDTDSSNDSGSSLSDIYSTESSDLSASSDLASSNIYSTSNSDSSSDIYSISPTSDISSSYTASFYSSTSIEPTSATTDIYSSVPTSLYSTITPQKCYVAVVVTSRVSSAYSAAY
ncbi:hypothetical protein FBU31_001365 [Coemansia sp. 'formosensis']|nr:hypothetical protein FBU31_001365 [Coemansia sp. 'formosensis']